MGLGGGSLSCEDEIHHMFCNLIFCGVASSCSRWVWFGRLFVAGKHLTHPLVTDSQS
jgi:hypothetical protein